MSSQGEVSNNNKLLTLLNNVRQKEYEEGLPIETLIDVDKSHNIFEKVWIPVMIVLFFLVAASGTHFWPSIITMRIFEYLFTTSVHIYFIFKILRSMIPGEFEKPIQYSVLLAVPIGSAISVGTRMIVTKWALNTPAYFGHVSSTITRDWLHPIVLENKFLPLHIAFATAVVLVFVIIWIHSKVKLKNLIIPYIFYMMGCIIIVYAMNSALAILSRLTTDLMLLY